MQLSVETKQYKLFSVELFRHGDPFSVEPIYKIPLERLGKKLSNTVPVMNIVAFQLCLNSLREVCVIPSGCLQETFSRLL